MDKHESKIENSNVSALMSLSEAANYLGICYRTIQTLVYDRKIGFIRVGRHYKFRLSDLEAFVERNYIKPIK